MHFQGDLKKLFFRTQEKFFEVGKENRLFVKEKELKGRLKNKNY